MIYKFREGRTYRGVDPQVVGDELERIRNANGGKLATTEVVKWAAEPDSPIHDCFTWDNEQAAQAHRLSEARGLIRAVVVVHSDTAVPQPAYWNVSVARPTPESETAVEQYYQSAEVIAKNPDEFAAALKIMLRELAGAQRGLEQLRRLAPKSGLVKVDRASASLASAQQSLSALTEK